MKSVTTFLVLFVLVATIQTKNLQFNYQKSVIQINRQWIRFKIGIQGGSSPYRYLYDSYPESWKPVFSHLYMQKSNLIDNTKYPCRIRVFDKRGNQWKGTVILRYKDNKLSLDKQVYGYEHVFNDQFFKKGDFSGIPKMTVNRLTMKSNTFDRQYIRPSFTEQGQQVIQQINSLSRNPGSSTYKLSDVIQNIYIQNDYSNKFSLTALLKEIQKQKSDELRKQIENRANRQTIDRNINYQRYNSIQNQDLSDFSNFVPRNQQTQSKIQTNNQNIFPIIPTRFPTTNNTRFPTKNNTIFPTKNNTIFPTASNNNNNSNIINIRANESSLSTPIDKIFLRLPTQKQLDEIILTADSLAILKTIQNVIRSDLNCSDKVFYLQDFLGRIKSAIQMKTFTAEQLQVIIEAAKTQILRLQNQIGKSESRIQSLGIKQLQVSLNTQLEKLEASYNKFNTIQIQIQPQLAKIAGFQKDINDLRKANEEYRSLLSDQNLKLVSAQSDIEKLGIALKNAQDRKNSIVVNIKKIEGQILSSQQQINSDFEQIRKIEAKIKNLQEKSDQAKLQSKSLEIKVQRIQQDLIEAQEKQDQLKQRLQSLRQKTRLQNLKLATQQLKKLRNMVESLTKAVPSVQSEIDTFNFQCQKLAMQTKQSNNVLVYIVGQKDYTNYIQSIYGNVSIQKNQIKSSLELSTISVLSPLWKSTYGNPFSSQQMANRNQFSFDGDFNCLNPSLLTSGSGIIRDIRQKSIYVEVNTKSSRKEYQLNLGACTLIETTATVPKIGQSIYWRGNNIADRKFNIYRATCI